MKSTDINTAIRRAGTSQAAIARHLKVSPAAVSSVVNGHSRSAKIENELAKIVGKRPFGATPKPGKKRTIWTGRLTGAGALA